jgi:hypothetical protein
MFNDSTYRMDAMHGHLLEYSNNFRALHSTGEDLRAQDQMLHITGVFS